MAKSKAKVKTISVDAMVNVIDGMRHDVNKFNDGVNAPGSRIRKGCQELKRLAQEMRGAITEIKNSRK